MAGVTITQAQAMLDSGFPVSGSTQAVAYSTNGTSEFANLARTAIGAAGWASATSADPSIKANNAVLTSAAVVTAGGTITHFAVYSATSAGTQLTDWTTLTASRALSVGDSLQWAIGALAVTLT